MKTKLSKNMFLIRLNNRTQTRDYKYPWINFWLMYSTVVAQRLGFWTDWDTDSYDTRILKIKNA